MKNIFGIFVVLLMAGSVYGADLSLDTEYYSVGGLFTNPLFPAEHNSVTITVRTKIEGEIVGDIKANIGIKAPSGKVINEAVVLKVDEGGKTATGSIDWKTLANGQYFVTATVDPNNEIAESDENNNSGTIELPVLLKGREPHFPRYSAVKHLRWATIWTSSGRKYNERWGERGVKALRWTYGTNLAGEWDANTVDEKLGGILEGWPGFGADECGGYATPATWEKFKKYTDGLKKIKERMPEKFLYIWHCGSTYPEQMAMYRGAADLVVLESYINYWGPRQLGHENMFTGLDIKMLPAWQADLLGPTGKGTQVITSVDLTSTHHKGSEKAFNRGKMEEVIRHLRRKWPEMRGIGFYSGPNNVANDRFVDSLCHDYFVMPVVTVRPGNLWVNKQDDGSYMVTAAVSNIGAMDSGAVAVKFYADGKLLKSTMLDKVPAGNNILENQIRVEAKWTPKSGGHDLKVELGPAAGNTTILDHKQATTYYVP